MTNTSSLPDFTPVPRKRMRRGGWSAERQRAFIEALADTGSVRSACRRLGVGEHHIYKLRRHPEAESFRKAWEAALDIGIAKLEDVAMDRALNGAEEPVYHGGELVGTRRVHNDRLLMFMLKNRAGDRFAESRHRSGGAWDAIARMELERRVAAERDKWRAAWDAEQAAKAPSPQEVRASIERKIEGLRDEHEKRRAREWEALSEETRSAWERFEELKARDLESIGLLDSADRSASADAPRPALKGENK